MKHLLPCNCGTYVTFFFFLFYEKTYVTQTEAAALYDLFLNVFLCLKISDQMLGNYKILSTHN
jgi:hypothetical protein